MEIKKSLFLYKLLLIGLVGMLVSSCVSREKIVYFQGDLESIEQMTANYSPVIQSDDLLIITVFGRDSEATKIFNQESNLSTTGSGTGSGGGGRFQTYLVDEEGNIEFPVLGKVKLAGLTRIEAMDHMKSLLSRDIIDPGVAISISNFKITMLGEVGSPGTYNLEDEKLTLLEAIGRAGDLTINGERKNVLVIREENGQRNFYRIDLTSNEVFTSPVYYLVQNDIVYVEPNQNKRNSSTSTVRDVSFAISITSFVITIIALITR